MGGKSSGRERRLSPDLYENSKPDQKVFMGEANRRDP